MGTAHTIIKPVYEALLLYAVVATLFAYIDIALYYEFPSEHKVLHSKIYLFSTIALPLVWDNLNVMPNSLKHLTLLVFVCIVHKKYGQIEHAQFLASTY